MGSMRTEILWEGLHLGFTEVRGKPFRSRTGGECEVWMGLEHIRGRSAKTFSGDALCLHPLGLISLFAPKSGKALCD